jgi:hypothetical protein
MDKLGIELVSLTFSIHSLICSDVECKTLWGFPFPSWEQLDENVSCFHWYP